jgi:biopolymer transport protein ExbB
MRNCLVLLLVIFVSGILFLRAKERAQRLPLDAGKYPEVAVEVSPAVSSSADRSASSLAGWLESIQAAGLSDFAKQGGMLMVPLAVLGFLAVLFTLYCGATVRKGTAAGKSFMSAAEPLIRRRDYLTLATLCRRERQAMARITGTTAEFATRNPGAGFDTLRTVIESAGNREAIRLNRRIACLADVGAVAPAVGLVGTVVTLIKILSHGNLAQANDHGLTSEGVAQVLITTATGLVIGIPSLIAYSLFRRKVRKITTELESAMTCLGSWFAPQPPPSVGSAVAQVETEDVTVAPPASQRGEA